MADKTTNDVLILLIQVGIPVLGTLGGTLAGIWLGKRLEDNNKKYELKKEVYLNSNRTLQAFSSYFIAASANGKNREKLNEENQKLQTARADLEVFGSKDLLQQMTKCQELALNCGHEAIEKTEKGKKIHISSDLENYEKFLKEREKFVEMIKAELGIS